MYEVDKKVELLVHIPD